MEPTVLASSGRAHSQQDPPQPLADAAMVASLLGDVGMNEKALEATAGGVLGDNRLMPQSVLKYSGEVEVALRRMRGTYPPLRACVRTRPSHHVNVGAVNT